MEIINTIASFQVMTPPQDPKIDYDAALYFLDGHYLFRQKRRTGWVSKFVTAEDVRAAFTGQENDSGWLPAGIVRAGTSKAGKWFVYSAPTQKATIQFEGDEAPIKIPLPRTLLVGVGANYYLWALTGEHFEPGAIAHAAPFPNVHGDGRICWGAATPPRADPEKARGVWKLFFETPFNNHLIDRKSKAHPEDVRSQLRALEGKREYPTNDLQPTMAAASSLIERIIKG
jgi:hypothetical protein